MIIDTIYYLIKSGGPVMLPIFLVGALGFYFVFNVINRFGRDYWRKDFSTMIHRFNELLNIGDIEATRQFLRTQRGLVAFELRRALEHPEWSEHHIRVSVGVQIRSRLVEMDQGMHLASVLAATAPLLGLLGTVTGMVSTFDVITLYGNSNPVLLADGISEALITTQSGLLIAFPMVLLLRRAEERGTWVKKQLELGMTLILHWAHARTGEQ